jgi:membrane fusion protein, multidrug efflux system
MLQATLLTHAPGDVMNVDRTLARGTARPSLRSTRARRAVVVLPLALAAALAAFALPGCAAKKAPRNPRVSVTVATVERRDVPVALLASGTVEAVQTARIGSQVGGVVVRIAFREGQEVAAGQALVELDPRPFRAALQQSQAALTRDLAQWRVARADAQRAEELAKQDLVSPAALDDARATAEGLHAAVQADSASVAKARLDLEYATIRAPVAGRTGDLTVHVGDLVKAATSDPLVTVNQVRPILVRFTLTQDDLPLVRRYQDQHPRVIARLTEGDSTAIEGRLVFVDNAVDANNGTLLLKGEFANRDGRLWPGQYVEVRLVLTTQKDALVVPAPAVTTGQQGTYVVVMNADSTASVRPVKVVRADDVIAVLADGVKAGETVITDGQYRIAPGARVVVRPAAGSAGK